MKNVKNLMERIVNWKWFIAGLGFAAAVVVFAVNSHHKFEAAIIESFLSQQRLLASSLQTLTLDYIEDAEQILDHIADDISGDPLSQESRDLITTFFYNPTDDFISLSLFDSRGDLLFAVPEEAVTDSANIAAVKDNIQRYSDAAERLVAGKYINSEGSIITQLFIHFISGQDDYYLQGKIKIEDHLESYLSPSEFKDICYFVADEAGELFSLLNVDHQDQVVMKAGNLFSLDAECTACHQPDDFLDIRQASVEERIVSAVFTYPTTETTNRTTAPFHIFDKVWTISVCSSYGDIQDTIDDNFQDLILSSLLIILVIGSLSGVNYMAQKRRAILQAEADNLQEIARISGELKASEEKYRTFFENTREGVYISKDDGGILSFNSAARSILGFEPDDDISHIKTTDLYYDLKDREKFLKLIQDEGFVSNFETRLVKKDGSVIDVSISSYIEKEIEGNITFRGFVSDITEQKKAVEALRFRQSREAVQRLARKITHDNNNLLTSAFGYVELAMLKADRNSEEYRRLNQIKAAHTRMARLNEMLADFAGTGGAMTQTLDLSEQVGLWNEVSHPQIEDHIKLVIEPFEGKVGVLSDPDQMQRLIGYSVENAAEMIPEGGKIVLEIEVVELDEEQFDPVGAAVSPGNYAVLVITDNGEGMKPEEIKDAFLPDLLTTEVGSGKGILLPGISELMRQNGGFLKIESEPGAGTRLELYFPLTETA